MDEEKDIYLDYHATTPVLPQVMEAMSPYFCNHFGNANSSHRWGWKADMALSKATKQVADLVGAKASQVYFTSGATESLHWAIVGFARKNKNCKIITTAVEHKATYGACDFAKELGAHVVILPVDEFGRLKLEALEAELKEEVPTLISFIYGNNEIGTLNPIQDICALKEKYPHLKVHADAAQCVGKVPMNFESLGLDYLCFSGHKLYAPKGIGVLVVKDPDSLAPLFTGGGQQRGLRAGTTDIPSIVGLGAACAWANENLEKESKRLRELRDLMINKFLETDLVVLNGHPTERLPNNMSFTFKNITMDKLLLKLPKVGFSSSSACTSGDPSVSHVLEALGRTEQEARQTVRFGMGYSTTAEDMEYVTDKVLEALSEAKNFSSASK
jgi:cysteine desulfurase